MVISQPRPVLRSTHALVMSDARHSCGNFHFGIWKSSFGYGPHTFGRFTPCRSICRTWTETASGQDERQTGPPLVSSTGESIKTVLFLIPQRIASNRRKLLRGHLCICAVLFPGLCSLITFHNATSFSSKRSIQFISMMSLVFVHGLALVT